MKDVYRKLVSFTSAKQLISASLTPVSETDTVSLEDAVGRINAVDLFSPGNTPPFNRSTMDGYAVRAADTENSGHENPVRLKIVGESFIGMLPPDLEMNGTCIRISTGCMIPPGADAVVRVEATRQDGSICLITEPVKPGENIAESGSDSVKGDLILSKGTVIQPHEVAVLASLGIDRLQVHRKVKIAIISTGNELINPGDAYTPGKIYDANSKMIISTLSQLRFLETHFLGIIRDDFSSIERIIQKALETADIVILSGGSSAGEADLVYRVIESFDPGIIFHGILTKPGLPTVFGKCGSKPIIGLPGFPVSATMILRAVFLPYIVEMAGSTEQVRGQMRPLGTRIPLDVGKQNLIPVRSGNSSLYPVMGLSGSITRLLQTTGYISIEGTTKYLEPNTSVNYFPWVDLSRAAGAEIVGTLDESNLKLLRRYLSSIRMMNTGLETGLHMVRNGDASGILIRIAVHASEEWHHYIPDHILESCRVFAVQEGSVLISLGEESYNTPDRILLDIAESFLGPPIRYFENILNKNQAEREFLASLRENVSKYGRRSERNTLKIELSFSRKDSLRAAMRFVDVIAVGRDRNDLIYALKDKFTEL